MLSSEFFLFWNYDIKLVLLDSNIGLNFIKSWWKLFTLSDLIIQSCKVLLGLLFVFNGLLIDTVVSQFHFRNCIFELFKLVLCSFSFIISLLKFSYKFCIIIFCLMESFIQSCICWLLSSDLFLKIFKLCNILIKQWRKWVTILFKSFTFLFETFYLKLIKDIL